MAASTRWLGLLLRVTCKPNAMVSMQGYAGSTLGLPCGCMNRSDTLMSVSGSNTHALAAFEKSVVQLCSCPRLLLSRVPSSQKRPWHCPADLAADSYRHSRRLMHLTCSVPLPLAFCLHSTHKSRASRHVEAIAPSPSLAWLGATPPMRADRNGWCCRRSQAGFRTALARVPHWYIALTRS